MCGRVTARRAAANRKYLDDFEGNPPSNAFSFTAGRMVCRLQCTGKEILCTLRQTCIGTVPWQHRTVPAASVSVSIAELGGRVRYLRKMAQVHAHSEGKVGSSDVLVSHHESLTIKGS